MAPTPILVRPHTPVAVHAPGPVGVTDHGGLNGLSDDDHPQYLTQGRGDVLYDATGAAAAAAAGASGALAAHAAASDPHPQYQTQAEGDARYDATGAAAAASAGASSALAAHVSAPDPHPQYQTAAAVSSIITAAIGSAIQGYNTTLAALSGLTTEAFGRGLLNIASAAALRTVIDLPNATTANRLARYTGAAGELGEAAGIYEAAGGNVGIGTDVPGAKLDVFGGTLRLSSANAAYYTDLINAANGASAFRIQHHGVDILHTTVDGYNAITLGNGASKLVVSPLNVNAYFTGNVGIGVTVPDKRLHVEDANANIAKFRKTVAGGQILVLDAVNSATVTDWVAFKTNNEFYTYGAINTAPYALNIGAQFNIQLSPGSIGGVAKAAVTVGYNEYAQTVGYRFGVVPGAADQVGVRIRGASGQTAALQEWQSSGGVVLAAVGSSGNLGIGTAAPASKLHVAEGIVRTDGTPFSPSNFGIVNYVSRGSAAVPTAVAVGDVFTIQQTQVRGNLAHGAPFSIKFTATAVSNYMVEGIYSIDTANAAGGTAKALTISSLNGRVGINTASPEWTLDVNGSFAIRGYQVVYSGTTLSGYLGNGANIFTSGINAASDFGIRAIGNFGISANNSLSAQFVLNTSGNVGVGTTTPTAKIDNAGDTYRQRLSRTPSSSSDAGNAGDICWDADYVYVCVATNTWKRSALATW